MQQQIWKKNSGHWKIPWWASRKKCFSPNFNGLAIFVLFSSSTYQSARANTYWWLWLPIFNVCWRKQSTFPGRIPAQGLIIPEHWVHKLRWQWALRRWNWTRCEKIRHKEAGLGGTKVESTQGRPWPCPQKIIKAPCQKFPDRKSCWQEILFTRPPFSGYKHTCTGKIVIWKCPCRYEGAGTLIIHLQFQAYFSDLLCIKILWTTLVNCLQISYFLTFFSR